MSQYIFKDANMKARLIRQADDWYVCEYKYNYMTSWFPGICGTASFLKLSEQDMKWAINA